MDNKIIFIKTYIILFVIIVVTIGCSDNSVNNDNEDLPGLFVADSFTVRIETSINPVNDSRLDSLYYELIYHFENQPGSVSNFNVVIQDTFGVIINFSSVYPKRMNESGYLGYSIELSRLNLTIVDSVKVDVSVAGAFWDYNFETSEFNGFLDTFNWSDSKWVPMPK